MAQEKSGGHSGTPAAGSVPLNPGDDAAPGTPGTGEDICPECSGTGRLESRECQNCGGTGRVIKGLAGG